ncbi:MAG: hypothetical protein WCP35_01480 [Verrucomicrobiota bacterium]
MEIQHSRLDATLTHRKNTVTLAALRDKRVPLTSNTGFNGA